VNRRILLAATLLILPTAAFAQRGGGSRATKRDPDMEKMFGPSGPTGPTLRPCDIEDFSPIHMLIDKRKDLKLSDAQLDGLKKAENPLKEKNAPLMKAVDSLVREMRPPMNMTDEAKAHIRDADGALRETLKSIQSNYDAATNDALATFDADQKTKANELLARLKEDADKRVREKMNAGNAEKAG
jgi:hypothetical protein